MPVRAIPKVSTARNGLGAFVTPCHRIRVQYCNWGGSSKGVRAVLAGEGIKKFAASKPSIVVELIKRSGHPTLSFEYNNEQTRTVDIANADETTVLQKLAEFSQYSGQKLYKFNHRVKSENESVRGVWSPLHVHKDVRHKI